MRKVQKVDCVNIKRLQNNKQKRQQTHLVIFTHSGNVRKGGER